MTSNNRGMSTAQAKALAADPTIAPGVMVRLANSYPETWPILLSNPAVYPELQIWLTNSIAHGNTQTNAESDTASKRVVSKPAATPVRRKRRRRGAQTSKFAKIVISSIIAGSAVAALVFAVGYVSTMELPAGLSTTIDIREKPLENSAWEYDLRVDGEDDCADYSISTVGQGLAAVLVQNNLSDSDCTDVDNPIPSTLALLDLQSGEEMWKIDFADELTWTKEWRKEFVEVHGLNMILVKFVDVNGQDASDDSASTDDDESDRKMKTLVPYNPLNGRITDAVIAGSDAQPTMQAPVLEVLGIPGNPTDVLVMSNGNEFDFRYARYHVKKMTDELWHQESDLQPVKGNPIVGEFLVLGREDDDEPKAIETRYGHWNPWLGEPGGQIFNVRGDYVQIFSDCKASTLSNKSCQGGRDGTETRITGISTTGDSLWSGDYTGFAVTRDDSLVTQVTASEVSSLFALSGDNNADVSLLEAQDGAVLWTSRIDSHRFEIGRVGNGEFVPVYLLDKNDDETMRYVMLSTSRGWTSPSVEIVGDQARIDAMSNETAYLVDEPDRKSLSEDLESGDLRVSSEEDDDSEDEIRECIFATNKDDAVPLWSLDCGEKQSVVKVGGYLLLVDKEAGRQALSPLAIVEEL